ncbi:MAG: glycosyl hydrolase family 32 [Planctomycetota bacterium]|jgi:hypothetical protein
MGECLENGIELPDCWPPQDRGLNRPTVPPVPYLENPPGVITIDRGRQLFIDDFLIDFTIQGTMQRFQHQPVKHPGNPVFFSQTAEEHNETMAPCAVAKSGGVWHDAQDQKFKMWYMASYLGSACYAESEDGVHWTRPELDVVPGTNCILPKSIRPDSGSVLIDYEANREERYKMMLREPDNFPGSTSIDPQAYMMVSSDGIHWKETGRTGGMGDRSTLFYNPFRRKWVQSIRDNSNTLGRFRRYREADTFLGSAGWKELSENAAWARADHMDQGRYAFPELYNVDAVAYESVMLGFFQILKGPPNHIGEALGMPKLTELTLGSSRDGFHFHRPDREAFIGARREPGSWEYGYVESSAGMVCVVGDELYIYYSAYGGDPKRTPSETWHTNGTYANGAVGLAKLRRDGFASMRPCFANAITQTRPVRFSGSHLFVNANTVGDRLRVEVRDLSGKPIPGFTFGDCNGFMGNSTGSQVTWKEHSLAPLAGQPVRFCFQMDRGDLYSFWVAADATGASNGFVGAGGPGFTGPTDTIGVHC